MYRFAGDFEASRGVSENHGVARLRLAVLQSLLLAQSEVRSLSELEAASLVRDLEIGIRFGHHVQDRRLQARCLSGSKMLRDAPLTIAN